MTKKVKIINKKDKQFYWNKFARNDYLYFAVSRIHTHFWNFIYNYPKFNCFYVCSKINGDFNGSFNNIKKKLENPFDIQESFWETAYNLINRVCLDLYYGNIGKYAYIIIRKEKYYVMYRVELKDLKEKNKILKNLRNYRDGKITNYANSTFMKKVEMTSYFDPNIVVEYPNKKIKMFNNKKVYSG